MKKMFFLALFGLCSMLSYSQIVVDKVVKFENKNSKLFMAVKNSSKEAGAEIVQVSNDKNESKHWIIKTQHEAKSNKDIYIIENENSKLFLSIYGSEVNGAYPIGLEPKDSHHYWVIIPVGKEYVKIKNNNTKLFLGVKDGSKSEDAKIMEWKDQGQDDILWKIVEVKK